MVPFIAAEEFVGSKPGYVFKNGFRGLGYYIDYVGLSYEQFVPSAKFTGSREGYVFKMGPAGLG